MNKGKTIISHGATICASVFLILLMQIGLDVHLSNLLVKLMGNVSPLGRIIYHFDIDKTKFEPFHHLIVPV
jgi:hypothetical protein